MRPATCAPINPNVIYAILLYIYNTRARIPQHTCVCAPLQGLRRSSAQNILRVARTLECVFARARARALSAQLSRRKNSLAKPGTVRNNGLPLIRPRSGERLRVVGAPG